LTSDAAGNRKWGKARPLTTAATFFIIQRKAYFPHLFTSRASLSQFYPAISRSASIVVVENSTGVYERNLAQ
jgi:hypothetical protein